MKYLCLAYEEEGRLNALSRNEWDSLRRETLAYVEELRTGGYLVSAETLQSARAASTWTPPRCTRPRWRPACGCAAGSGS